LQFKKEILKTETFLYQDIFILVGKKVFAGFFIDRCLLKKRNYFLANPIEYKNPQQFYENYEMIAKFEKQIYIQHLIGIKNYKKQLSSFR